MTNKEPGEKCPVERLVIWREYPADPPPELTWGQYECYLVASQHGKVFEASWLFGGWHANHSGCSNITKQVEFWCEKPSAPKAI